MSKKKKYLSDGVYADYDGYHIVLTAENGIETTNTIYLDDTTTEALLNFIKSLKEKECQE